MLNAKVPLARDYLRLPDRGLEWWSNGVLGPWQEMASHGRLAREKGEKITSDYLALPCDLAPGVRVRTTMKDLLSGR